MSLSQDPKACDCRGNAREVHAVRLLFRGAGGTVTYDSVPADDAHRVVEACATRPYRDAAGHPVAGEPVVIVRPGGYTGPSTVPGGSRTHVPEAVIVIVPAEVQSVMLL